MKKYVLLAFLFFKGINMIYAQAKYSQPSNDFVEFHNSIATAERMYKNDSLLQAYAIYDLAFANYKGGVNPSHYFKASLCALKIKEEYKALHFLEKALLNGYSIDSAKRSQVVFYNQNTKREYEANIAKWEADGQASKNAAWQSELYATVDANKKYASPSYKAAIDYCTACMKNPKCSKSAPEYLTKYKMVKEKMKSDSVLAASLLNNIRTYGFPNAKLLDKRACEIARNILLNYDADKTNERLDPLLFRALNDGYISPAFYAQVIDRRNVMNGIEPEFYEPLMGYEKTIGKNLPVVNKNRKKIGLYNVIMPNAAALKGIDPKDTKAYNKAFVSLYDY